MCTTFIGCLCASCELKAAVADFCGRRQDDLCYSCVLDYTTQRASTIFHTFHRSTMASLFCKSCLDEIPSWEPVQVLVTKNFTVGHEGKSSQLAMAPQLPSTKAVAESLTGGREVP